MEHRPAYWTHDDKAADEIGEHLYYFAPEGRAAPPYKTQRHVEAIIDIAEDGTLAGVELIDNMPPPPRSMDDEDHIRWTIDRSRNLKKLPPCFWIYMATLPS